MSEEPMSFSLPRNTPWEIKIEVNRLGPLCPFPVVIDAKLIRDSGTVGITMEFSEEQAKALHAGMGKILEGIHEAKHDAQPSDKQETGLDTCRKDEYPEWNETPDGKMCFQCGCLEEFGHQEGCPWLRNSQPTGVDV
jgi:hypothetical protein